MQIYNTKTCTTPPRALPLQRVFHGIDLRLIRLVVVRQPFIFLSLI